MLNITFEFVGGPNDGKVEQGKLGEPTDAERHYLFSHHGRIGQRFAVASDYAVETLADEGLESGHSIQRHHYVVTDRLEEGSEVWVRAEYVAPDSPSPASSPAKLTEKSAKLTEKSAKPAEKSTKSSPEDPAPVEPRRLDGQLLIASPRLNDPLFAQTVILIVDQNEEETLGLILNRPTTETVADLWEEVSEIPCENQQPIHVGGPVDGPVMVLHEDDSAGDVEVIPGVFLSIEKDNLEWIVQQDHVAQRLFVGTTGWDAEQLEDEFTDGDWLVLPATKELVSADPTEQWSQAMRAHGRAFLKSIGVRHIPDDVRAN